jgi:hypothetical protein
MLSQNFHCISINFIMFSIFFSRLISNNHTVVDELTFFDVSIDLKGFSLKKKINKYSIMYPFLNHIKIHKNSLHHD